MMVMFDWNRLDYTHRDSYAIRVTLVTSATIITTVNTTRVFQLRYNDYVPISPAHDAILFNTPSLITWQSGALPIRMALYRADTLLGFFKESINLIHFECFIPVHSSLVVI
jgi:hypothetical protein